MSEMRTKTTTWAALFCTCQLLSARPTGANLHIIVERVSCALGGNLPRGRLVDAESLGLGEHAHNNETDARFRRTGRCISSFTRAQIISSSSSSSAKDDAPPSLFVVITPVIDATLLPLIPRRPLAHLLPSIPSSSSLIDCRKRRSPTPSQESCRPQYMTHQRRRHE